MTGLPPCTQISTKTFTRITKPPGGGLINMKHNKPRLKGDHHVNSSPFWQIQCHPASADSHYDFIMRQQRRGGPAQPQFKCSGRLADPESTHMKASSISAREERWWETTLFCLKTLSRTVGSNVTLIPHPRFISYSHSRLLCVTARGGTSGRAKGDGREIPTAFDYLLSSKTFLIIILQQILHWETCLYSSSGSEMPS